MSAKSCRSLPFWLAVGLWAALSLAAEACGYHSVYAQPASSRMSVAMGQVLSPESVAAQAALSGARAELAAAGLLEDSPQFPRLVLDLLRVDEVSRAVHVQDGQARAGGMGIGVVVRGRVLRAATEEEPALDTGDLRRAVQMTGDADPRVDGAAYDAAVRAAAERAGRAAARAAMGIPEPSDEAP